MKKEVLQDEEDEAQHRHAEGMMNAKRIDTVLGKEEYIIDQLVNHSNENGKWWFKVRWYGYTIAEDA